MPTPGDDDGPHSLIEVGGLGRALGPALHESCGDKLGELEWFSTPWQRSGAATGYTHWRLPNGEVIDAIAKVPVGYREWYWSTHLGETDPMWWESAESEHLPVPRVLASGVELGEYDVAWLVVERVGGGSVRSTLSEEVPRAERAAMVERLFDAVARFQVMAGREREVTAEDAAPRRDWAALIEKSARAVADNPMPDEARWAALIDRVGARLDALVSVWRGRDQSTWCHGDVHPGNVLTRPCRTTRPGGDGHAAGEDEGVLIDLGLVHAGHWLEDALYLERLYWGHSEMLGGVEPVRALSEARGRLGVESSLELCAEVAEVRRVLMAATSPAFLGQEHEGAYLSTALGHLEAAAGRGLI